ncbi:DUF805 domain-containing protein [Massilia atriviolacea]|uniref:DUF805 domain-containing protein n=1 Tax=Massilia atriviolacea TaxID=2495579 RepID=A0A430HIE1_9BURK|nr:DUF805 domain-containing protein [Massilia atriviolacea]RSZ57285.1 DUF805 domain-containing protein [Massilia atriviolacea]
MDNPYAPPASGQGAPQDRGAAYLPTPFSLEGRIGRMRFLVYALLPPTVLVLVLAYLLGPLGLARQPGIAQLAGAAVGLAALAIVLAMTRRRLHDLARPGWWALLMLLAPFNLLVIAYLLCRPGDAGWNRFGPAPDENTTLVSAGVWIMLLLGVTAIVAQFDIR